MVGPTFEMKVSIQKHIGRERPKGDDCEMGVTHKELKRLNNKNHIHRINKNCNNQKILCAVS